MTSRQIGSLAADQGLGGAFFELVGTPGGATATDGSPVAIDAPPSGGRAATRACACGVTAKDVVEGARACCRSAS